MKRIIFRIMTIFFGVFFALGLGGCRKYLEIPPPSVLLSSTSVYSNGSTATAGLMNIYGGMSVNNESYSMSLSTGLLGDELTNYSNTSAQIELYQNAMNANSTNATFGCWVNGYKYIYQANELIESVTNNSAISYAIQHQLVGEAKFIRAFWYFYLTNSYGDLPLVTGTDYQLNSTLARTAQADIYQQIIADLNDAQDLLNTNFVDVSDTLATTDRVRPTKWAAEALLSRVSLYTGDYIRADSLATNVINNNSTFGLVSNLDSVFLVNSKEAIWQLATGLPSSYNTPDGNSYILLTTPGLSGAGVTISPQLKNTFEPTDLRQSHWIGTFVDSTLSPSVSYFFPFKYKVYQTNPSGTIAEYVMVLRLAEQFLIRAEARVYEGKIFGTNGALADLDAIRSRAGLSNYAGPMDANSVLQAILHERQVELFTEWGHRWFDLIRTGNINSVMGSPGNVCHSKGGSWVNTDKLFPIPQYDRNTDHNLTQNLGY